MIKKEVVTSRVEVWRNPEKTHRYAFWKTWEIEGGKSGDNIAVVITIHPIDTEPFTNDLSMLLIEKNVRKLGFTGFIAVNLFSFIELKKKKTYSEGNDDQSLEIIQAMLKEKQVNQIIFACGAILNSNPLAMTQAKIIYDRMTAKQKKLVKILVDTSGKGVHPLNVYSRKKWLLADIGEMLD